MRLLVSVMLASLLFAVTGPILAEGEPTASKRPEVVGQRGPEGAVPSTHVDLGLPRWLDSGKRKLQTVVQRFGLPTGLPSNPLCMEVCVAADLEVGLARSAYDSCVALKGPNGCEAQARALAEANARLDDCTSCQADGPWRPPVCVFPMRC